MGPSPQPQDQERPATILETDDEIRQALHKNLPTRAVVEKQEESRPRAAKPASPTPETACPYRPTIRPVLALLTVFDDGKAEGEVIRIRAERFVIGRSEGDLLIAHDELISGRHVEITRHCVAGQYRFVISDLQTRNGLFIRVSRTILADQAEFLVGKGRYRFEDAAGGDVVDTVDQLPSGTDGPGTRPWAAAAGRSPHAAVVELVAGATGARLPLVNSEYWVGRNADCAICRADDPFVEPRHVRLYRDAKGAWHAQNNKSANGLWVKVPQITVDDGCLFQIGEQRFRLRVGG